MVRIGRGVGVGSTVELAELSFDPATQAELDAAAMTTRFTYGTLAASAADQVVASLTATAGQHFAMFLGISTQTVASNRVKWKFTFTDDTTETLEGAAGNTLKVNWCQRGGLLQLVPSTPSVDSVAAVDTTKKVKKIEALSGTANAATLTATISALEVPV